MSTQTTKVQSDVLLNLLAAYMPEKRYALSSSDWVRALLEMAETHEFLFKDLWIHTGYPPRCEAVNRWLQGLRRSAWVLDLPGFTWVQFPESWRTSMIEWNEKKVTPEIKAELQEVASKLGELISNAPAAIIEDAP